MAPELSFLRLSDAIEPLCPRDSRIMQCDYTRADFGPAWPSL